MVNEDVSEFDGKIISYLEKGVRPSHIGERLNIPAREVWARIKDLGIEVDENPPAQTAITSIWEMDEDRRRKAFAKRAAEGARRALRA